MLVSIPVLVLRMCSWPEFSFCRWTSSGNTLGHLTLSACTHLWEDDVTILILTNSIIVLFSLSICKCCYLPSSVCYWAYISASSMQCLWYVSYWWRYECWVDQTDWRNMPVADLYPEYLGWRVYILVTIVTRWHDIHQEIIIGFEIIQFFSCVFGGNIGLT